MMTSHDHSGVNPQRLLLDSSPQALALPRQLEVHRLRLFYGDLHNHTSYSDGAGRPEDALRQMRARGLHFAAITDHSEFFDGATSSRDPHNWALTAAQTAAHSDDEFLAIRGFEWSSPHQGHSNVWWSAEVIDYRQTGDRSMHAYYTWLATSQPVAEGRVLASFNHPGREIACFDEYTFAPALDEHIVALECFNRGDEYGGAYVRALDRGWHVGAIGVSDHHGRDWGSAALPRAGVLAPALTLSCLQEALQGRRVFATRSPTLALLTTGNDMLMGARLRLRAQEPLRIGVWCDDPLAERDRTRLELWTNGNTLIATHETRGLQRLSWGVTLEPQGDGERWFVVRVLHGRITRAYSSPIWARWR